MFTITIGRKDKSAQTAPVSAPKVKRPRGAWKADPISPKQISTIAAMFRRLDLVEGDSVTFGGHTFRYDDTLVRPGGVGGWVGLGDLTKGEASDLMDKLFAVPATGFSPVTEAQADPIAAAPKAAPKKRGETVTVDGVTYRIAGIAR